MAAPSALQQSRPATSRPEGTGARNRHRASWRVAAHWLLQVGLPMAALSLPAVHASAQTATPESAAGRLIMASGTVLIKSHDATDAKPGKAGDWLHPGQLISTGSDGRAQIRFSDGALVSLQPASKFRIDQYRFNKQEQRGFYSLLEGTIRAISGRIGKRDSEDFRLDTPSATIGIRGTEFVVQQYQCAPQCAPGQKDGLSVAVTQGRVFVYNAAGNIELPAGRATYVASPNSRPVPTASKPVLSTPPTRKEKAAEKARAEAEKANAEENTSKEESAESSTGNSSEKQENSSRKNDGSQENGSNTSSSGNSGKSSDNDAAGGNGSSQTSTARAPANATQVQRNPASANGAEYIENRSGNTNGTSRNRATGDETNSAAAQDNAGPGGANPTPSNASQPGTAAAATDGRTGSSNASAPSATQSGNNDPAATGSQNSVNASNQSNAGENPVSDDVGNGAGQAHGSPTRTGSTEGTATADDAPTQPAAPDRTNANTGDGASRPGTQESAGSSSNDGAGQNPPLTDTPGMSSGTESTPADNVAGTVRPEAPEAGAGSANNTDTGNTSPAIPAPAPGTASDTNDDLHANSVTADTNTGAGANADTGTTGTGTGTGNHGDSGSGMQPGATSGNPGTDANPVTPAPATDGGAASATDLAPSVNDGEASSGAAPAPTSPAAPSASAEPLLTDSAPQPDTGNTATPAPLPTEQPAGPTTAQPEPSPSPADNAPALVPAQPAPPITPVEPELPDPTPALPLTPPDPVAPPAQLKPPATLVTPAGPMLKPGEMSGGRNVRVSVTRTPWYSTDYRFHDQTQAVLLDEKLQLQRLGNCGFFSACLHRDTAVYVDTGHDGTVSWGRWQGGKVRLGRMLFDLQEALKQEASIHYVVGTPTLTMPTEGSARYELVGATSPTFGSGAHAPGSFTGHGFVQFGPGTGTRVALDGELKFGNTQLYRMSTQGAQFDQNNQLIGTGPNGLRMNGSNTFSGQLQVQSLGQEDVLKCGEGDCRAAVDGAFFGEQAGRLGFTYSVANPQHANDTDTINGAAVMGRVQP
ncbi:MAG: FecR domain-containing protein [Lautropia sp.]|nr:FecR domain-containing protein [Lautropia sp.]